MKHNQIKAQLLLSAFLIQLLTPIMTYALTAGPSQPEFNGFQEAGSSDLVDLFSGDFNYNIPLMELPGPNGGYPFNLTYNSNLTMEDEASWVGLGWSMTPGVITRQMRGIPDEFNGEDLMKTVTDMRSDITVGMTGNLNVEAFGADPDIGNLKLNIYYNNFKGIGLTHSAMFGYSNSLFSGKTGHIDGSMQVGFTSDNQNGLSINPSIGLDNAFHNYGNRLTLSSDYNIRSGLSGAISLVVPIYKNLSLDRTFNFSSSIPSYIPSIGLERITQSFSGTFKLGPGFNGLFADAEIGGYYNESKLKNNGKEVLQKLYGYLNSQKYKDESNAVMDINREHDGAVTKEIPNLPIPFPTYDIFAIAGQGLSGSFRAYRRDQMMYGDPSVKSKSGAYSFGFDAGIPGHIGGDFTTNHSKNESGRWTAGNELHQIEDYQGSKSNINFEPWFFSMNGETNVVSTVQEPAYIHTEGASYLPLTGNNKDASLSRNIQTNQENTELVSLKFNGRIPRQTVISSLKNEEILYGDNEFIKIFDIEVYDESGNLSHYDRSSLPSHHFAGFSVITADGIRYNYCLPAYTASHSQYQFSVSPDETETKYTDVKAQGSDHPEYQYQKTNKFYQKTELPPYAHAYLLTSIVGPDYIDANQNGVDKEDYGYWIKFSYQKSSGSNAYIWRNPFSKAFFDEGSIVDTRDNQGNFSTGEKELWFLRRAESKSHIIDFMLEDREDARGAATWSQDTNSSGNVPMKRLTEMKLYSRTGGPEKPIKRVIFDQNYSLCKKIPNRSVNPDSGKLTLQKVWFEYGSSSRGAKTPYVFSYSNNPDFKEMGFDRWGYYKSEDSPAKLLSFPYTIQDQGKESADSDAAAWCLDSIRLPSGADISVHYESDDYAFVQNKPAMQMAAIIPTGSSSLFELSDNKVRFKLEQKISESEISEGLLMKDVVEQYIDTSNPLYFKFRINLKRPSDNIFDDVAGYVEVDGDQAMTLEKAQSSDNFYSYGTFYVKTEGSHSYNPFRLRAWQHLRLNQPQLAYGNYELNPLTTEKQIINFIKSLATPLLNVQQMFLGFDRHAKIKNWGYIVDASKSWIRVLSPDKEKYGGGARVRQITIHDNWANNSPGNDREGIYGQIFEYTQEEQGKIISSGVAAYEPYAGGDENPFRLPKKWTQSILLKSNEHVYFEYPLNESQFPGASVGYNQVSVMSLAAAKKAGKELWNVGDLFSRTAGNDFGTSGKQIYRFFTARDFPVITHESEKQYEDFDNGKAMFLLGRVGSQGLTISQGYSVITNNMHGKPQAIESYVQGKDGQFDDNPVSYVNYQYLSEQSYEKGSLFQSVNDKFTKNSDGTISPASSDEKENLYFVGERVEILHDTRTYHDEVWAGGVHVNLDNALFIPVPTSFPNVSKSSTLLRICSTNKIIQRTGILIATEAYDGGSRVRTKHLKWDSLTGVPVLSKVNNNFEQAIYSYQKPAYTSYKGMGPAYQNIGLKFTVENVSNLNGQVTFTSPVAEELLFRGDEIILYPYGTTSNPVTSAYYLGKKDGNHVIEAMESLIEDSYTAMVIRSGRRNMLRTPTISIKALSDPTVTSGSMSVSKTVSIPSIN